MLIAQHGVAQYSTGGPPPPTGNTAFIFQVTTTYGGQSITIPHLSGYIYNYIVDYGDGTILPVTAYDDPNCTHTFAVATGHTISISGVCETFYVNWSGTMPATLTRILQWGDVGFLRLNMWGCASLLSMVADTIGGFRKITDLSYAFGYCYNLPSIPAHLLDFATGATNMYGLFYYCATVTSIPVDFLKYNTLVTNMGWAFYGYGAYYGASPIPVDLFRYNTLVTTFGGVFYNSRITSIPATLFKYNNLVNDFQQAFASCGYLTSLPEGLFTGCTSTTNFGYVFQYCNSLTTLPNKLFPVSANYFYLTFYSCQGLSTIPNGLFTGCTSAYYFYQTFYNCVNITGAVPELWVQFPSATGTDCFALDVNASNFNSIPEDWGGKRIRFWLEVTTTGYGQTITIPHLTGYTYNYNIDYGDGYKFHVTGATDPNCTHTYTNPQAYIIKISGVCETFFMKSAGTMFTGLTKVLTWGKVGMKKMNFSGSTTLVSIAASDPLYGLSGITNFTNIFANCVNIESPAPALWKQYSAATGTDCFINDSKTYNYSYIPIAWGGLGGVATPLQFEVNIPYIGFPVYLPLRQKNYDNTYDYVFDFDIDWGDGTGIFHVSSNYDPNYYHNYVSGGTCIISISGICETIDCWQGQNTYYFTQVLRKVKQWGQVQLLNVKFMSCSQLTDVLANDGKGVSLVTDWTYGFYNCPMLSGITGGMFTGCTNVVSFNYVFMQDPALTTLPATLFRDSTKVNTIQQAFYYCTALTAIPATLFDTWTGLTSGTLYFNYCFYNCPALTGAAPALWTLSPPPTRQGYQCFYNDTGLTNYAAAQAAGWA